MHKLKKCKHRYVIILAIILYQIYVSIFGLGDCMFSLRNIVKLKYLFISVIALAFVLSTLVGVYSNYKGNLKLMQEQTLENNRVYALKLAETVDKFIVHATNTMRYSAEQIGYNFNNMNELQEEAKRLYIQGDTFSSVLIVDAEDNIMVNAPQKLGEAGKKVLSLEGLENYNKYEPFISDPFISPTGRKLIVISMPIYDEQGIFKGVLSGNIYLYESNIFESILGQHPYENGSYVYVVDTQGEIIYHPNKARLGEDASENEDVVRLLNEKQGALTFVNTLDQPMLAGFSQSEKTRWGIIVQTPYDAALSMVWQQVVSVFKIGLPFIIFSTIIVFILASQIVRPLEKIAEISGDSVKEQEMNKLKDIRAWYYEVYKIQKALIHSFSILHGKVNTLKEETTTDSLTKLLNRHTFEEKIKVLTVQKKDYTLVMLDVDWFKSINDTYGHVKGDEVLQALASKLKESLKENELACRYGGEEFILVFTETTVEEAYERVESLQEKVLQIISPAGEKLTFSAGISNYPLHGDQLKDIIVKADEALYKAKENGRNRVEVTNA